MQNSCEDLEYLPHGLLPSPSSFGPRRRRPCDARLSTTSPQFWRRRLMKSELVKPIHLARKVSSISGSRRPIR